LKFASRDSSDLKRKAALVCGLSFFDAFHFLATIRFLARPSIDCAALASPIRGSPDPAAAFPRTRPN